MKHSVWRGRAVAAKYGSFGVHSSEWGGGDFWRLNCCYFPFIFFKFRLLQITLYSIYVFYTLFNVTVVWWRKKLVYRTTTPPLKRQCSRWRTYGSFGANSKNSCLGKGGRMCKGWSTFIFQFLFLIIYFYKPLHICVLYILFDEVLWHIKKVFSTTPLLMTHERGEADNTGWVSPATTRPPWVTVEHSISEEKK